MAKTSAQIKATHRENKREQGYVLKQVWVKPSWWPQVKRLIDRLTG